MAHSPPRGDKDIPDCRTQHHITTMSSKDSIPADGGEKAVQVANTSPDTAAVGYTTDIHNDYDDEPFLTRSGLNIDSFKCKHYGYGFVELDRAMKGRHLHMIAIGGSIGAGFFVGSGGALYKGVSCQPFASCCAGFVALPSLA